MINAFCLKHNYTKNLKINPELWGHLYDNGTGDGTQWDVVQGHADIGSGGFFRNRFDYRTDTTTVISRVGLNFLVPRPVLDDGLETPLRPFDFVVWIVLLVAIVVLAVVTTILHKINKREITSLTVLGLFLQQPSHLPMRMYLTYSGILLIVIFYNCGYASLMTRPSYLPYISTGKALENSNLPFILATSGYITSLDKMQYPNIKTKYTKADPDKLSQILAKSTKVSIAIDHLNLGYAFCEYDTVLKMDTLEKFTVLKEDMSFAYGVFAFYKNSVILPLLDHFILNLQEYGLDNFIMAESFRELSYEGRVYMHALNQRQGSSPRYFNIRTLSGAFLILLLGLLIATIAFICEVTMCTFCC
ncbi:uncharacterized protein [Atheta coriaria]